MKPITKYSIIILLALAVSCVSEQKKSQNHSGPQPILNTRFSFNVGNTTFNTGGGLGGYFIEFNNSNGYKTYSFCDICSGGGSYGVYTQNSRKITMRDTLCFENKPHFTDKTEYIDCKPPVTKTYYIVSKNNEYFLSQNAQDTLNGIELDVESYPNYSPGKIEALLRDHRFN